MYLVDSNLSKAAVTVEQLLLCNYGPKYAIFTSVQTSVRSYKGLRLFRTLVLTMRLQHLLQVGSNNV